VMEVYGVDTCSQYPANGSVKFTAVHVYDLNGSETTPSTWNRDDNTSDPQCAIGVAASTHKTTITFNAQ